MWEPHVVITKKNIFDEISWLRIFLKKNSLSAQSLIKWSTTALISLNYFFLTIDSELNKCFSQHKAKYLIKLQLAILPSSEGWIFLSYVLCVCVYLYVWVLTLKLFIFPVDVNSNCSSCTHFWSNFLLCLNCYQ